MTTEYRLDLHATYSRAELYLSMAEPTEAARILAPVVDAEPDNASVLELLARAYFASAQLTRAEETLRRLLEVAPTNAWAHRALARTWERQSRHAEAERRHLVADALGAA
jgi:Flp pilus assembly protein TadD